MQLISTPVYPAAALPMQDTHRRHAPARHRVRVLGLASAAAPGEEPADFFCEAELAIARQFAEATLRPFNRAGVGQLRPPTLAAQCLAGEGSVAPACAAPQ